MQQRNGAQQAKERHGKAGDYSAKAVYLLAADLFVTVANLVLLELVKDGGTILIPAMKEGG